LVTVLGFDCAGGACSAAVLVDGRIASHRFAAMERGQAEALVPMIKSALDEAAVHVGALDLIAVTRGPGSFTGLRTGLAAARGLALASRLPLIGVTCFDAAAEAAKDEAGGRPLVVALESKREELFLQRFDPAGPGEPALVPREAWGAFVPDADFVLAGDATRRLAMALGRADAAISAAAGAVDAVHVARLAGARWQHGTRPPLPLPLYLRAPDTTAPA
jgi:tRNA threonylcarbamoyladenosine biosynthesis protein TsaB